MDDPNMEWEIQEYSPSEKGEVTRVRWILNKGLGLGKKVVITGIAISSAPLFVPPLVVFSAMGFAFSVPFGLLFASYAFTDKVMSKLLPTPEPYTMIDSYTDEDEDDDYWQKDIDGYEEQPTMYEDENVEEEREEDVRKDVEEEADYMGEIQKEIEVGDRYVEEQGYKDIGDDVEREDDLVARAVKGGEEEFIGNEVEAQQDTGNKEELIDDEEDDIVRESTWLLEKIRDVRNIGNEVEETRGAERMHRVGEGEVEKNISIRESVDSFEDEDMLMNKPIEEVKATSVKGRFVEETKMPFQEADVTAGKLEKIRRTAVQTRDEERDDLYSLKKVEAEDTVVGNGNNIHDLNGTVNVQVIGQNVDRTVKEQRLVVAKKVDVKEGREADNTSTGVPEDIAAKMTLEYRDADIREIVDESGLHLYDDRNAANHQKSCTASQSIDVDGNLKEGTVEVDVDYMALPTLVRVSESNNVKRGADEESEEDVGEDDYMGEIQKENEVGDIYVEEQGYKDIGDDVERKDDLVARAVKGGEEEFIGNEVEAQQDTGNREKLIDDEEEEIVRESTGLPEKIRDARNIDNEVEEETRGAERMHRVGEGEVEKNISIRESVDSFEDEDVLMNKPIEEVKGTGEKERFVEETKISFQEDDATEGKPEKIERTAIQTRNEERDVHYSLKEVGETEDTVVGKGNNIHDLNGTVNVQVIGQNVDRTVKERRPVVAKKVEVKEGREADNTSTGVSEDIAAKMTLEYRDADIREIVDESRLHLYDDRNAASRQISYTASQSLDVDDNLKEDTVEVDVDYMALPTSVRVSESNNVQRGAEKEAVRSEVLHKEEKMWEQINALRAIMGYTAAPQTDCVEEVKALYIFTGVEPPFSFKDPSDLADINEKLRFLMSIVGVK